MSMGPTFLTPPELAKVGFRGVGRDVLISRYASILTPESIELGDHVRIDDFCLLSGNIRIGSYVHIGAYSALFGAEGIVLEDFAGLSARVTVYSVSDDYLGKGLTNPTVPLRCRHLKRGPVRVGRHAIVGAGTVILPGVTLGEGVAVGALALVAGTMAPWKIVSGNPARARADRRKDIILKLQQTLD